ncbi:MAG: hypothetical protein AVDCRST_MAG59-877, partial [uncultured Thermomicrobiales bacterium]
EHGGRRGRHRLGRVRREHGLPPGPARPERGAAGPLRARLPDIAPGGGADPADPGQTGHDPDRDAERREDPPLRRGDGAAAGLPRGRQHQDGPDRGRRRPDPGRGRRRPGTRTGHRPHRRGGPGPVGALRPAGRGRGDVVHRERPLPPAGATADRLCPRRPSPRRCHPAVRARHRDRAPERLRHRRGRRRRAHPRPGRRRRRRRLGAAGRRRGGPSDRDPAGAPPVDGHRANPRRRRRPGDLPGDRRQRLRPPGRRRPAARRLRAGPAGGLSGRPAGGVPGRRPAARPRRRRPPRRVGGGDLPGHPGGAGPRAARRPADDDRRRPPPRRAGSGARRLLRDHRVLRRRPVGVAGSGPTAGRADRPRDAVAAAGRAGGRPLRAGAGRRRRGPRRRALGLLPPLRGGGL